MEDSRRTRILTKLTAMVQANAEWTKMTCEANLASENSSFIFTVCVKSVPLYHFKLAYVGLHMAVKELFEAHV